MDYEILKSFDRAFIDKLKGLKIKTSKGSIEVPVIYINPQDEFEPTKLPCIVVYRNGLYQDLYGWRYDNSKYYTDVVYDKEGIPISGKEVSATEPYNLYYGIRAFYELQGDGATLNFYINSKLHRGTYITVGKEAYDIDFLSYKNPEGTYRTFGQKDLKAPKVWVEQYLFKVEADLIVEDEGEEVKFSRQFKPRLS